VRGEWLADNGSSTEIFPRFALKRELQANLVWIYENVWGMWMSMAEPARVRGGVVFNRDYFRAFGSSFEYNSAPEFPDIFNDFTDG
jgi:hypothetical protein